MQIARAAEHSLEVADSAFEQDETIEKLRCAEMLARAEFEQLMELLADRQDDAPYAHRIP